MRVYGYTAADAQNAAYAAVPRYFVKRDLLAGGVVFDGALMILPQTQPIAPTNPVTPAPGTTPVPTRSAVPAPAPVLVIPHGRIIPPMRSDNMTIVRNVRSSLRDGTIASR